MYVENNNNKKSTTERKSHGSTTICVTVCELSQCVQLSMHNTTFS